MGFGGLLNDDRSINTVDEMLGIIPGQTRTYVAAATGSVAMGGTPLNPQQLPIHSANCITGNTSGGLSAAAKTVLTTTTAGTGLTASTASATFTIGTGTPAIGSVVLNSSGAYVGTVLTTTPSYTFTANAAVNATSEAYTYASNIATGLTASTGSRSFSVVSGAPAAGDTVYDMSAPATPVYIGTVLTTSPYTFVNYATTTTSAVAYAFISSARKNQVAYTYDVELPTTSMPVNNVSYTIQAGDDFEQEVMKYAKCTGFSAQGGAGGTIDMQASYMGQAVQLGYVGDGTISVSGTTVTGYGTSFINTSVSSDIGRKLYTLDNVFIGEILLVGSATDVTLKATSPVTLTYSQYRLGGFSSNTGVAAPVDDLIFARSRLFINDVQSWPVQRPTPVVYQFLAFSAQLQCTWATKFTGEGYQGIDPTWAFALFTNYQVGGDFTIEHDTIASGKKSASSVESLKYAWRNRVPKIIQVDCPGSTVLDWFTVTAAASAKTLTYTFPATSATGTISIDAGSPLVVNGVGTSFAGGDIGKSVCVKVNNQYYYVGRIAASPAPASGLVTLDANMYGAIPAGSVYAFDATEVTGGSSSFVIGTDENKDLFENATTWLGRIASIDSATVAHTYVSSAIGTFNIDNTPGYIMQNCATQPYFPVVGQGPLKSYTGISWRLPVQIMSVSGINDNDGNDIVTVSWQQRYDPAVAYGGDIRIVNQVPSLSVAN